MQIQAPLPGQKVIYQSRENVLIFDMNNEYGEYGIKSMPVEYIPVLNEKPIKEIRRIIPFRFDKEKNKVVRLKTSEMITLLERVIELFKNGKLIIEDPSKFLGKNMTDDLVGMICTNRHSSVDIVMHYQSINRPLPVIHENTNIYRFHHQGDDVYRAEGKLQDTTEAFKICQILVDNRYKLSRDPKHPCKRFFVFYYKDNNCILGDFGPIEFNNALYDYIDIQKGQLKEFVNKRDRNTGALVYPEYKDAVEAFRKQLFDAYYGNDIEIPDSDREALFMIASGMKGVGKTAESMRETIEEYCGLPLPPIFAEMRKKSADYLAKEKLKKAA